MTMRRLYSVLGAGLLAAPVALAMWVRPEEVPVEKLLPQLEARVEKNPLDAHGHYLLGRVHGAALAFQSKEILLLGRVIEDDEQEDPIVSPRVGELEKRTPLGAQQALRHLTEGCRHLSIAVALQPKNALYHNGLASVLEAGLDRAAKIDSSVIDTRLLGALTEEETQRAQQDLDALAIADETQRRAIDARMKQLGPRAIYFLSARRTTPPAGDAECLGRWLTAAWRELAIHHYMAAFEGTIQAELAEKFAMPYLDDMNDCISYDAAEALLRLIPQRGAATEEDRKLTDRLTESMEKLKQRPGGVTPILLPDDRNATVAELLDGTETDFDLAGAGVPTRWPWPSPSASLLVWDPECTGEIRSGRQLIGSRTWWMFFEDGYRALEALDADGDGWLVGGELEGLALWRDADRDGVSDPGEIESLDARGIVALATEADGADASDGVSPRASRGVLLRDGTTAPTIDWIARPLPPAP